MAMTPEQAQLARKARIIYFFALVLFVLWLGLLAAFFWANVDEPASNGWNYAVAIVTTAGAVLFFTLGMISMWYSDQEIVDKSDRMRQKYGLGRYRD